MENNKPRSERRKQTFAALCGWFAIHVVFLITSNTENISAKTLVAYKNKHQTFWPIDGEYHSLSINYDGTEFMVYAVIPLLTFIVYSFMTRK